MGSHYRIFHYDANTFLRLILNHIFKVNLRLYSWGLVLLLNVSENLKHNFLQAKNLMILQEWSSCCLKNEVNCDSSLIYPCGLQISAVVSLAATLFVQ